MLFGTVHVCTYKAASSVVISLNVMSTTVGDRSMRVWGGWTAKTAYPHIFPTESSCFLREHSGVDAACQFVATYMTHRVPKAVGMTSNDWAPIPGITPFATKPLGCTIPTHNVNLTGSVLFPNIVAKFGGTVVVSSLFEPCHEVPKAFRDIKKKIIN